MLYSHYKRRKLRLRRLSNLPKNSKLVNDSDLNSERNTLLLRHKCTRVGRPVRDPVLQTSGHKAAWGALSETVMAYKVTRRRRGRQAQSHVGQSRPTFTCVTCWISP